MSELDQEPVVAYERLPGHTNLAGVIQTQTEHVLQIAWWFTNHRTASARIIETNEEAWPLFHTEHLYDIRQVTLKGFHLFEWFPRSPGPLNTMNDSG